MDGVSAVASIGAIVDGAFTVIEILNTIRHGGKQRRRLLKAISSLWTVLQSVQLALYTDDDESTTSNPHALEALRSSNGVFAQVDMTIAKLKARLEQKQGGHKAIENLAWPFSKEDVEASMSELEKLTSAISLALASTTLTTVRETQKITSEIRLTTTNAEHKAMLDWISPFDIIKQQHKIASQVHEGTGQWFLQKDVFQSWTLGKTSTLWCPGIPGAGKTHLASTIYSHMRDNSDNVNLIIYCGYVDPSDQNRDNFLRALIRQILQLRPDLSHDLRETYRAYSKTGKNLLPAELLSTFRDLRSKLQTCSIVIDALDDIREEPERYKLLTMVVGHQINVLVTSRPLENIGDLFSFDSQCWTCQKRPAFFLRNASEEGKSDICESCATEYHATPPAQMIPNAHRLDIEASQEDLHKYVQWRIDGSGPLANCLKRQDNFNLREELVATVVARAKGMFLLTKLHMDMLVYKRTPNAIRNALRELPSAVNATYDQALLRIKPPRDENNEEDSRYAMTLLMWMTFAKRPLTISEMEHAVTTSMNIVDLPFDEDCLMKVDDVDPDEVLSASELTSMCAGLVIIDASNKVLFVHFTTQDYFLANSSKLFPEAHRALARSCLTYLSMETFQKGPCAEPYKAEVEGRVRQYPLMIYSSCYAGLHLHQSKSQTLIQSAQTLLRTQAFVRSICQMIDHRTGWDADRFFCQVIDYHTGKSVDDLKSPVNDSLRIAAYWSLSHLYPTQSADKSSEE